MQDMDMKRLEELNWILDDKSSFSDKEQYAYSPPYGDVTTLNRCRLIMDSVGQETLRRIGEYSIFLLNTSVAIYEANGDYAFGLFSSEWCQMMDLASRELCGTNDNKKALSCGKWLCHENCWNDSAKRAIETGKSTDIECVGGIHLYAEPIFANHRIIGVINIGYGDPPKEIEKLKSLSELFHIDYKKLQEIGEDYNSRPKFINEAAKKLLGAFAKMIGEMVEKAEAERALKKAQEREIYYNKVLRTINNVNQLIAKENNPHQFISKACHTLIGNLGYFNAWISLLDDDNQQATFTGSAGFDGDFAPMRDKLERGMYPACMRRSLASDKITVITDPVVQCADCPLSEKYIGRSALIRRLKHGKRVFGFLCVSAPRDFADGNKEKDFFLELTDDIAFALYKIEMENDIKLKNHIIRTLPQPMAIITTDYRYLTVNEAYVRLYGTQMENIVGKSLSCLMGQTLFERKVKPMIDRCMGGESTQYEIQIDFPGVGPRWMLMEYFPLQNKEKQITGVVSHGMDISNLRQIERDLRQYRTRNQALLDHSPVCHKIVDIDFNLQYMSANGFNMLKLNHHDDVYGKPYPFYFFPETFRNEMTENLKRIRKTGKTLTMEALANDIKGNEVWLESSLIPVFDDDGEIDYITVVSANTTQRKLHEKEKERLEKKLVQAQKMEAIGNIAGGIAHDFNNILFPIIGMSELLLEDLPEDSLEYENALEILTAGKRGAELIRQILAFSRQSEHKMMPTRIQHILKEVLKLSRSTIPSYIEIGQEIQSDCGLVMADPTQIHQIAMNIITNAYHAVEADGGKITVGLREVSLEAFELPAPHLEPGKYAILSVSDTGNGISPELMDKIFDPYFTTKEQGKGTGLGLAVVFGIVQEHKGDIKVYSEIGKGTTFNVYLPLMRKTITSDTKKVIENHQTGGERILLVDDEPSVAKLEKLMLERLGYSVTMCTNSMETLAAFKANPDSFDLIMSDMNMPNMTGDQLADKIKSIRTDIPIILCTGFSERMDDKKADILGIAGILMKPVSKSELAKTVRKVLDGGKRKP